MTHMVANIPTVPATAGARLAACRRRRQLQKAARRRQRLLSFAVMSVFAAAVLLAAVLPGSAVPALESGATQDIRVQPGETLWDIASRSATPGESVHALVLQIRELNGLEGSGIAAGQRLTVPAGEGAMFAAR